ncbi:Bifunctional protein FolD Methylenetetrahydrofolate dehydrogenase (1.5.1.5) Methenyltetrahydrofolate cyclohydrolase (3.5.4.9) [Alteracholeplasma palmae J233]|uniref:Bifunctional protein FolD n=1 Tax=Alteracholeplasma palmae (strain ATCC 49389 / J233) TaxID=1318466 RepID=U4KLX3_ALTPJ|nr:bifunctional 5,10-methylenetetrahydrofolate dehydrogenase/5,10-methenyltetrahydrofolate cyclohydrolase [Alteracholeplasma palmae]CCV64962.1 Bifunctional protein FolD Methylenetetrahydrofolate dehydrogenase (1.5.1.5) Methenyltetrahydrofolate cyclohydrolase (3.5.4.9) [Alteracholeplasma palmae J233]
MILLDGKMVSEELNLKLKNKVDSFDVKPQLDIILIGNNPASLSYVKGKKKAASLVGITTNLHHLDENISQEEVERLINSLNQDEKVDGILLQLPIPKHLDQEYLMDLIAYEKDPDGFHVVNQGKLFQKRKTIYPATPKGIMTLLDYYNIPIEGKSVVVVGRSNIVGMPISKMLLDRNATVTICHSKTKNIKEITKTADILVVAIGIPKFITKDMVKQDVVLVDVGINRVDEKLVGDADFDEIKDIASYITPVPKGVGPMTIHSLLFNTVLLYESKNTK